MLSLVNKLKSIYFNYCSLIINTYNQHSNRRSMTQILFDEWGSSGRRRPRVSDLLQILVKAQLYRIADYVAFNVLNGTNLI